MSLELVQVSSEKYGIDKKEADDLLLSLNQIKAEKEVLREQYNEIINLDIDDPKTWKLAGDIWRKIRDNRTKGIEPWRKSKKEWSLRYGQFIDATAKVESEDNQRMEDNLELIKKRKELLEAQRIQDLRTERWGKIKEYTDVEPDGLGTMDDEMFEIVSSGLKQKHQEKIKAQKESERLRIEQEEKEKAERERIRLENEALHAQIKKEREEAEARQKEIEENAKKEREEAEARQKEIEENAKKEREEIERLAKEEADKKQLRSELLRPYIVFIRDYNKVISLSDEDFNKELSDIKKVAQDHWEYERKEQLKAQQEQERKDLEAKKQAEILAQKEAELKAIKDTEIKAEKERLAKLEAEKLEAEKLAKGPIKKQLNAWVDGFGISSFSGENEKAKEIEQKFNSFKEWAKSEISKM